MRNILYTRRKYEKINPAAFDQEITPLVQSFTTNDTGEKIASFTPGTPIRAMVDKINSSEEDSDFYKRNQFSKDVIVIITYTNQDLLNNQNRILWAGKTLEIIDTTEAYARGRWVRVKCVILE